MSIFSDIAVTAASLVTIWGIITWRKQLDLKRASDLADEAITLIYYLRDAIQNIRSPATYSQEISGLVLDGNESDKVKNAKERAYVIYSRIKSHFEKLNDSIRVKNRCKIVFGNEVSSMFDDLIGIIRDINITTQMLADYYWVEDYFNSEEEKIRFKEERRKAEIKVCNIKENDVTQKKIDCIVAAAEQYFEKFLRVELNQVGCLKRIWNRIGINCKRQF